jgi:GTP-binding protein Era
MIDTRRREEPGVFPGLQGQDQRKAGAGKKEPSAGGFRAGFVAIVGRPNVGKSTLMNSLLKEKVAIVSDKPQTTRNTIRGILTTDDYQIVFLDTPGIHKPRDEINRYMVGKALSTLHEVDLILFMVEPDDRVGKGDQYIGKTLAEVKTPVFLLVNKIDLMQDEERASVVEGYGQVCPGRQVFAISALRGEGLQTVLERSVERLPEGHPYFPSDQYTDQPLRFLSAEIIREKAFHFTGEEIPYSVAVEICSYKEDPQSPSGLVAIEANIHVERSSQKGILIGKGGQMLKRIGTAARHDLETLLDTKVFLKLWVKVSKGWRNDPKSLRKLGYR